MMKTLSQIIATFLALGIAFLASYIVYLYSAKANIDDKILHNGSEIASLIKSAPVYTDMYNRHIYIFDYHPFMQYRHKSPNSTPINIHEDIAWDLVKAKIFQDKDAIERLSVFKKQNGEKQIIGRIWIHLIKKSIDYLAPKEVWWEGRTPVPVMTGYPRPTTQKELFPFGPIGVEMWSADFEAVRNNINFLLYHQEYFLPDLQKYFENAFEERRKSGTVIDLNDWVKKIENIVSQMEKKNIHIQSLLMLKDSYSLANRLPNRYGIYILGISTFIVGVIIPIGWLCFRSEHLISKKANIIISLIAIMLLCGTAVLLGKDVLSGHKNEIVIKYLGLPQN